MRENIIQLRTGKRRIPADTRRENRDGVRELQREEHAAWGAEKFRDALRIFRTIFGSETLLRALTVAAAEERTLIALDKTRPTAATL